MEYLLNNQQKEFVEKLHILNNPISKQYNDIPAFNKKIDEKTNMITAEPQNSLFKNFINRIKKITILESFFN